LLHEAGRHLHDGYSDRWHRQKSNYEGAARYRHHAREPVSGRRLARTDPGIPLLQKLSWLTMPHSTGPTAEPRALAQKLIARIAAGGPIPFHDYMDACLYDPEHGYYKKKEALGRGGDFITAPEISQVFGELIGLWAGETWRIAGQPREVRLIELGPGRGTLMADALRALRVLPGFLQSASVHLVETSAPLRALQERALS